MAETLINGYHVVTALCGKDPSETIAFSEFMNDLGDGFEETLLFGADTGLREFAIDYPTLSNFTTARTIEFSGALLTPAEYLWELFCRQKVDGTPFILKSSRDNQYYLVKFKDAALTQQKMLVAMFSNKSVFKQIRKAGVTVFDPAQLARVSYSFKTPIASATDNNPLPSNIWYNSVAGGENINASSEVTYQTNEQNGLAIVRLDQSGLTDFLNTYNGTSVSFYEAFLVMKMREATFAADVGIISNAHATAGSPALLGSSGTTKFYNLTFGANYTYRKNGIVFAESNQQAPMNTFGVVHIRNTAGWTMADGLVFGKDRLTSFPTRKANVDFGEIIISSSVLPSSQAREITEYLLTKWGIV
jgi:hypothetical protein